MKNLTKNQFPVLLIIAILILLPIASAETFSTCASNGWQDDTTYYLTNDLTYTGTQNCIEVNEEYRNVTIDCDGYTISGNGTSGVYINNIYHTTLQNCNVVGFEKGIYLIGTHDAEIINNTLINQSYYGIHPVDSNDSRFINNTIKNTYYGMYLEDARYNVLVNTTIENTFYAYYLNDSTNYNIMSNSLINDSTYAFYFFNSPDNSIINNTLIDVYTESDGIGSSPIYSENNIRKAAGGAYNMPEFNASTLLLSLAFVGVALTIMRRKRVE